MFRTKKNNHKFIILESSLINGRAFYHIKVRNSKVFFRGTLDEILSDTHLLFGLPSAQSCSIAIDACHSVSSDYDICNKIELAQCAAWRNLAATEDKYYPFMILGYGEKSQIRFESIDKHEKYTEYAEKLVKNNIISQFNQPSAFIIGCVASLNMNKPKRTPQLRLITKNNQVEPS